MSEAGPFDYYDELHTCSVCEDRYTTDDVCWSCRQQEMIDNDMPPIPLEILECPNCFHWNDPINSSCQVCGELFGMENL